MSNTIPEEQVTPIAGEDVVLEGATPEDSVEPAAVEAQSDIVPEAPAKPKRKRTKIAAAEADETEAKAEAPEEISVMGPEENERPEPKKNPPARSRRARSRPPADPVVSIDDQRTVETDADKRQSDLLDLIESQKGRKILTDIIQGVEHPADNPLLSYAVVYHGDIKVILPASEVVELPEDTRDLQPEEILHYLVTKRLGAEIDYIVQGIDQEAGVAAASRLAAMAARRREYYFSTDRDGMYLLYDGVVAEARVISVIRPGIFVEIFGLEVYIPLRELSYQRWLDASQHFQTGQRVLVKLLEVNRTDRDNIRVSASVKQASENPYERALQRYTIGSRYVGTVSLVDTHGVFVAMDGGIDCLCAFPKRGRPARGSRVTVRILGINHETNRIWGAITHMAATTQ